LPRVVLGQNCESGNILLLKPVYYSSDNDPEIYVAFIEHNVEGVWHFTNKIMCSAVYEGNVERLDIIRH